MSGERRRTPTCVVNLACFCIIKKVCIICNCIFDTFHIHSVHISKFGDMSCETTESMLASLQEADDDEPGMEDDFDKLLNSKET